MIEKVGGFLLGPVTLTIGARGHQLGRFFPQLLEAKVAIGEETAGVALGDATLERSGAR